MTKWLNLTLGAGLSAMFIGLFISALGYQPLHFGSAVPTPTPIIVKSGNFGKYLYGISDTKGANKKVAQYDPTLPPDDSVVVPALRELAGTGLSVTVTDDVQPVVETIDETNYVTFTVGRVKVLFELFRNSGGQVGTVRFWKQQV